LFCAANEIGLLRRSGSAVKSLTFSVKNNQRNSNAASMSQHRLARRLLNQKHFWPYAAIGTRWDTSQLPAIPDRPGSVLQAQPVPAWIMPP
jgi:hypothetical protein